MKWIKKNLSSIILGLVFFVGLGLLLYPSFSDYWNSFHQSRAIASYAEAVAAIDGVDYEKIWNDAIKYNEKLVNEKQNWILTDEQKEEYNSLLNITGNGIMGYIEIPTIDVSLPIYHGVDEAVLQIAIGHIEGSSLPVGGESSHCVISGHRGLKSAKLFTDLDRMAEGDIFILRTLNEVLTYEVDRISIVLPNQTEELLIDKEEDYCTLMTCTPYGVNTHRLLVRGHRIENDNERSVYVTADAMQIDPVLVAPIVAAPILLVLFEGMMIKYRKR